MAQGNDIDNERGLLTPYLVSLILIRVPMFEVTERQEPQDKETQTGSL